MRERGDVGHQLNVREQLRGRRVHDDMPPDVVVWEADGSIDGRSGYGEAIAVRLRRAGWSVEVVSLVRQRPDERQLEARAHVVSGGTTGVGADVAWLAAARLRLARVIDRAAAGAASVTGICFGAQLVATLLAGAGAVGPHPAGMQAGLVSVSEASGRNPHKVGSFHYHHVDAGALEAAGATIVLASEHTEVQAYELAGIRGVQFHPELQPAALHRLLRRHRSVVHEHGGCMRTAAATLRADRPRWTDVPWQRFVGEPVADAVVPSSLAA